MDPQGLLLLLLALDHDVICVCSVEHILSGPTEQDVVARAAEPEVDMGISCARSVRVDLASQNSMALDFSASLSGP
jgi:hypothetical protein